METIILWSCLALPKVSFALRSCPLHHVKDATSAFDNSMLEALSDFAGWPLPNWSWLKASLPAALGGLGVRQASLHASTAYISSLDQSRQLVTRILGLVPATTRHLTPALQDLSKVAKREKTGSPLRSWMSLSNNAISQRPLTRPCSMSSVLQPLTPGPKLWLSPPSLMLVTG